MNYTYAIPANLKQKLLSALRANGMAELANLLNPVVMEYGDLGLAYYAGVKGDNWDKHAIDCTITVCEKDVDRVKRAEKAIATWIERMLPGESGLVVRNIIVIPQLGEENLEHSAHRNHRQHYCQSAVFHPCLVLEKVHKRVEHICKQPSYGKRQQHTTQALQHQIGSHRADDNEHNAQKTS